MMNGIASVPCPGNEPVRSYAPGSPERASIQGKLRETLAEEIEIPVIVGGREIRTGRTAAAACPHDHGHRLAIVHQAGPEEVALAVESAEAAWRDWSETPWEERAAVFLRAAELLSGPWRDTLNAATMLNQSKTVYQAEIDAACELIDFWRFNVAFARRIYEDGPRSGPGVWNRVDYRPLEGFVLAITPFNFTAIAGNLPTAPALLGNVALWKPSPSACLSAYRIMQILRAAGLPDGVIQFLPGPVDGVVAPALERPELAGVHFTGSSGAFREVWGAVGRNIDRYRSYPRIVGETGGKDFVFLHPSADVPSAAAALVRGAFEFQGQKCSAASRAYVPRSLWPALRDALLGQVAEIRVGSPVDFRNFMAAVIHRDAYRRITSYLDVARESPDEEILCGGSGDDSTGWFIDPTIVLTRNPRSRLMEEEIFGPVLTVFVYEDPEIDEAVRLCATTSPYGLTGAVFATGRAEIARLTAAFRHAAGNFYINDKPTGAVVSQQPFGGARASGTNDKAGSPLNLLRWVSQRAIKETFVPPADFRYPFMAEE